MSSIPFKNGKLTPTKYLLYAGETLLATVYSYTFACSMIKYFVENTHFSSINLVTVFK